MAASQGFLEELSKCGSESQGWKHLGIITLPSFMYPALMPVSSTVTLRDELKRIRAENPRLYKALSLDKFD